MKRLLIDIVIYMALFSSMSITAYAASGVVRAFFQTELMKGIYVEDSVVVDGDALSEDEAPEGAEEITAPDGSDEPVPEDMDETTVADEPEDEHTDEPEDIEETLAVKEETDVDDEGQDLLINGEPLIPTNPEKPEIDQIEIEEEEYETEVQNTQ